MNKEPYIKIEIIGRLKHTIGYTDTIVIDDITGWTIFVRTLNRLRERHSKMLERKYKGVTK